MDSEQVKQVKQVNAPEVKGISIAVTYVVDRARAGLYQFWRNPENLPLFMTHLAAVQTVNSTRSRWLARRPYGGTLEWESEIIREVPNHRLDWRSINDTKIAHAGSVTFSEAPDDMGTIVHIEMKYFPLRGKVGESIATLLGKDADERIEADLYQFKALAESGALDLPVIETAPTPRLRWEAAF